MLRGQPPGSSGNAPLVILLIVSCSTLSSMCSTTAARPPGLKYASIFFVTIAANHDAIRLRKTYGRLTPFLLVMCLACEGSPWYGDEEDRGEIIVRFVDAEDKSPVSGIRVSVFRGPIYGVGEKVAEGRAGDSIYWNFYGRSKGNLPAGEFRVPVIAGEYWLVAGCPPRPYVWNEFGRDGCASFFLGSFQLAQRQRKVIVKHLLVEEEAVGQQREPPRRL